MFIAEGELESVIHNDKIFIDFAGLVDHYLGSLMLSAHDVDWSMADEVSIASFDTAKMIGEALLDTLSLYELRREIDEF